MKIIKLTVVFFLFSVIKSYTQPNCSAPLTGFIPINDLETAISPLTGRMGGLYPNGSNFLPMEHKTAGIKLASQVKSLDMNGIPDDVNGKIVWLSIGMSNCTQETQQFILQANSFAGKNPKLKFVDGAQGGQTASIISSPENPNYSTFWNTVNTRLANSGVNGKQVQVIWFKEANVAGTVPVQIYHDSLVVQIKRIMNELKIRFPNVKLCYLASRISARYASSALNPEPYSYMTGWAVKKVIEDQIKGDTKLAFSSPFAKSPWLSWGIYMWSDGNVPQKINPDIFFNCPVDYNSDGTHPSTNGAQKVGKLLLNFFSTDSTTTPWFLNSTNVSAGYGYENQRKYLMIFPNPVQNKITTDLSEFNGKPVILSVFNSTGQCVWQKSDLKVSHISIDFSGFKPGLYFLHIMDNQGIKSIEKITKD